jgi:hypothetical protein
MTFRTPTKFKYNRQAGVSLMLAVLVLAAITAIAFSLAAIILVEIRTSGDVTRTEPALYANLGVTEEAFFQYKRNIPTTSLNVPGCTSSSTANICTINNVTLNNPAPAIRSADNVPKVDVVYANTKNTYQMYDVSNFNKQYSKVTVDFLQNGSTGNLAITIRKTENDANGTVTYPLCSPNTTPCSTTLTSGAPAFSFSSFDITGQYDLILENMNTANGDNIVVSIKTYDPSNSTVLKGLPFTGQQVLDIYAKYLGLTRKYTVRIPITTSSFTAPGGGNSASFVGTDTTTQGNWHGSFGSQGYNVVGGTTSYPAFASVTTNNNLTYVWSDPILDVRGLYRSAASTSRLAATWYNTSPWTIDVNITSGTHQVSLYMLDFDPNNRVQTIDVLDATSGSVLSTHTVSNFFGGQYYTWNITGHVVFRMTPVVDNAVIGGIFFNN